MQPPNDLPPSALIEAKRLKVLLAQRQAEVRASLASSGAQLELLRSGSQEMRAEIVFLREQLTAQTSVIQAAEGRLAELRKQLDLAQAALMDRSSEVQKLAGEISGRDQIVDELRVRLKDVQETHAWTRTQYDEIRKREGIVQAQLVEREETIERIALDLSAHNEKLTSSDLRLAEQGGTITRLKASLASAKERLQHQRERSRRLQTDLERLRQKPAPTVGRALARIRRRLAALWKR